MGLISGIASAVIEGPEGMPSSHISMCGVDALHPYASKPLLSEQALQWWPETITDSIEIGWDFKQIPGGSHAIAQWSQNGGRTIGFEVVLSRLMKPVSTRNMMDKLRDPFELNTPISKRLKDNRPYNANIGGMIQYLRMYTRPTYAAGDFGYERALPPPFAILNVPGLGLNEDGSDSIYAVMVGCDVTYNLLFPNGAPRLATVSLSFKQVVQKPGSFAVNFRGIDSNFGFSGYEADAQLDAGHLGSINGIDPT